MGDGILRGRDRSRDRDEAPGSADSTSTISGIRTDASLDRTAIPLEHDTDDRIQPRIVGGEISDISQNPYQAEVDAGQGTLRQFCGGSIHDANWVITAAHCLKDSGTWEFGRLRVGAGVSNLAQVVISTFRSVDQIIVHPDWNLTTSANDIALVRLVSPLDLNGTTITPIAIPDGTSAN